MTKSQLDITNKSQEVCPLPAGDHTDPWGRGGEYLFWGSFSNPVTGFTQRARGLPFRFLDFREMAPAVSLRFELTVFKFKGLILYKYSILNIILELQHKLNWPTTSNSRVLGGFLLMN